MLRKVTELLSVLPVLLVALGTSTSAAPTAWPDCPGPTPSLDPPRTKLFVNACGPKYVIRGTNYNYTVVLTNVGNASYRRVKLTVIHEDPITRSSIPYSRALRPDYAVWTLNKFKPGRTFRVSFRLPFKQHNDPKGSNFVVDVRAYGPRASTNLTKDVIFIKK